MSEIPSCSNTQQGFVGYEDELISVFGKFLEQISGCNAESMDIQSEAPVLTDLFRRIVAEQAEVAVNKLLRDAPGFRSNENEVQARRLCLRFTNNPRLSINNGEEIKAEDGAKIKLELVNADSGKVVESGPDAEAELEIVLLEVRKEDDDGPWTSKTFSDNIVVGRAGTKLSGDLHPKLNKGICIINIIKLAKTSTSMKKGLFKLGARVGPHIGEGKSKSFTGNDYRGTYKKKSQIPELSDPVWRLNRIAKDKQIHKRLDEQGIRTVKDFWFRLSNDPEGLRRIWRNREKDWERSVAHARTCKLDQSTNSCIEPEEHNGVVQNIQVPTMVGECSTMNGGSPSAVHHADDFSVDNMGQYGRHGTIWDNMGPLYSPSPCYMQANHYGDQTHELHAEPQIDMPRLQKNWRVLMSVVTITRSMSRKRVCLGKPPVQKRQKVM